MRNTIRNTLHTHKLSMPQTIQVEYATGVRTIPLTEETMKTMTNFFDLGADGVYRFSVKKQSDFISKVI